MRSRCGPRWVSLWPCLTWMLVWHIACLKPSDEFPALGELCNQLDDDNDRLVDEGACLGGIAMCKARPCRLDCDDGQVDLDGEYETGCECALAFGGAESCNRRDDDCDGVIDEVVGALLAQQAGVCAGAREACVDGNWTREVFADLGRYEFDENTCDGLDNDCDGRADERCACVVGRVEPCGSDVGACMAGVHRCTPDGWTPCQGEVGPSEEGCNSVDDDCDGAVDEGIPGLEAPCAGGAGACRFEAVTICHPDEPQAPVICPIPLESAQGPEVCNGVDDDCDGTVDEDVNPRESCWIEEPFSSEWAQAVPRWCLVGRPRCVDGEYQCVGIRPPGEERCNGFDDDCDARIDEDPQAICPFESNAESTIGRCIDGGCTITECLGGRADQDGRYSNGCEFACTPSADTFDVCVPGELDCLDNCDNHDDDCDGVIDEQRTPPLNPGRGVCNGAPMVCDGGWLPMADYTGVVERYEGREATCDGLDNDCDGATDEGLAERYAERADDQCDGLDDDCDGRIDESGGCARIICAAGANQPPCNNCPAGTIVPVDEASGRWVCVPAGRFTLGQRNIFVGFPASPPVPVTITTPLLVQTHEVTLAQWALHLAPRAPHVAARLRDERCQADEPTACPVSGVNWFDAARYLNARSVEDGLEPCYALEDCRDFNLAVVCHPDVVRVPGCAGYRLPTEAEWEYFARAGTETLYWSGDDAADLTRVGWYRRNTLNPMPVCQLPALPPFHPWGLCDVHGNLAEWTESWLGPYPESLGGDPLVDPVGAPDGERRVWRGGWFGLSASEAAAAYRWGDEPSFFLEYIGFRPVRTAPRWLPDDERR